MTDNTHPETQLEAQPQLLVDYSEIPKMRPTEAVGLVGLAIEAEKKRATGAGVLYHRQDKWVTLDIDLTERQPAGRPVCGSAGCLAGLVQASRAPANWDLFVQSEIFLAGATPAWAGEDLNDWLQVNQDQHPSDWAAAALQLSPFQADRLFNWNNTYERLVRIAAEIEAGVHGEWPYTGHEY